MRPNESREGPEAIRELFSYAVGHAAAGDEDAYESTVCAISSELWCINEVEGVAESLAAGVVQLLGSPDVQRLGNGYTVGFLIDDDIEGSIPFRESDRTALVEALGQNLPSFEQAGAWVYLSSLIPKVAPDGRAVAALRRLSSADHLRMLACIPQALREFFTRCEDVSIRREVRSLLERLERHPDPEVSFEAKVELSRMAAT
jgi:hypothetical protein